MMHSSSKVAAEHLHRELASEAFRPPELMRRMVAEGKLGKKTGQGFYAWVKGKPRKATGTGSVDLRPLADRLVAPALNEAVACLRERIVADADLCDAGVIFGTGFAPHRGGPISAIKERGKESWLKTMAELRAKHGDRFVPDTGWDAI